MRLTEWTTCGGCAAKWGGAPLSGLLREFDQSSSDELLVGLAPFDDAAVFGAIAAANACSDVFAMGGRVVLALNVAAFPDGFPEDAIPEFLGAASAKVREAGGIVAGGHTIRSPEPIFGLAVQGLVDP